MLTLIVFLIILGILVFVHELGHFVVARRNGIKCEEFGFGFPPRMVGIQFMHGKDKEKSYEVESVQIKTSDIKIGKDEIIEETITEKIHTIEKIVPVKKWRIIWGSKDGDDENEKQDLHEAHKKKFSGGTIYSLNWFPLGGFVRIKGEDGREKNEKDSFAHKSAWIRIKVLAAGVIMNVALAWVLFSFLLFLGINKEVDQNETAISGTKIQIVTVASKSPAYEMGIREGDTIAKCVGQDARCGQPFANISELQAFVNENKGKEITLEIVRGDSLMNLTGVPRLQAPEGEGLLGIGLAQTIFVRYSLWESIKQGPVVMWNVLLMMGVVIKGIFAGDTSNIGGPLAIAHFTKQATALGFASIVQLAALLSINLAIVNILPIPALDGGRILFILIEKVKGSKISSEVESALHTGGFFLLMILMAYLVIHDLMRYGLGGIF